MYVKLFIGLTLALSLWGCGSNKPNGAGTGELVEVNPVPVNQIIRDNKPMLKAVVYKTNGDYDAYVPATYDPEAKRFISFPAPTDVSEANEPLRLADGWLLDRRGGIDMYTVFLRWTYPEYHALPAVPSIEELEKAIIPDAHVIDTRKINMTPIKAASDTAAVNAIIRGWKDELPSARI